RGDAVEPAALGEVADRDFEIAERLDGLGGELDVAHQVDLADFTDAHLLPHLLLFLDLQHFAGFADAEALRVEIERAEFAARCDELADFAGDWLTRRFGGFLK